MPTNPSQADSEKLRAFEERMSSEGAAGFADGPIPWESWDGTSTPETWRVQENTVRTEPRPKPGKPLGQRLLTGITRVAVLALGVGIAGVYFTSAGKPQLAMHGIQPMPLNTTAKPAAGFSLAADQEERLDSDMVDPNIFPAPAAGQPGIAVIAATTDPQESALTVQADTATEDAPADTIVPETTTPAPAQEAVQTETTQPVAASQQPTILPILRNVTMATQSPAQNTETVRTPPPPQTGTGNWVVNLASYNYESTAQRMLSTFRDKGVAAELVKVTVNDRPMIRIRTTGYENYREASDWAALLEERLELDGAWVSKR
ncbi:MAG: SPOR domain-containing protein [Gammaproteobacteria bacterium]|nr:SPOR domain-containing protein [Gammaproteobacteria bacterium]